MASVCGRLGFGAREAVKAFFTHPGNKLARIVNSTKGVDKIAKTAKAASEFTASVLEQTVGAEADSFISATKFAKGFGDARTVIALGNIFNGSLPGAVQNAKSVFSHIRAAKRGEDEDSEDGCVSHKRRAAAAACGFVGSVTYLTTFGMIRPALLVNKLLAKPFLSSGAKDGLGQSVGYIMAANHAATVLGAGLSISAERADCQARCERLAHENGQELLGEVDGQNQGKIAKEKAKSLTRIKYAILTMIEKFLECVADVFKLVPLPITQCVRAIVAAGCTLTSAVIGLCAFCSKV